MKKIISRALCMAVLMGTTMQAPLYAAQNDSDATMLQKYITKFRRAVSCAIAKDGCTDEQASEIRTIFFSILALLGIGVGVLLWRKKRGGKRPVIGRPRTGRTGVWGAYDVMLKGFKQKTGFGPAQPEVEEVEE